LNFVEIFGISKLESLGTICVILRLIIMRQHRLGLWHMDKETNTDRQRHTSMAYTMLAYHCAVKMKLKKQIEMKKLKVQQHTTS